MENCEYSVYLAADYSSQFNSVGYPASNDVIKYWLKS